MKSRAARFLARTWSMLALACAFGAASAQAPFIVMASTTSTEQSGLFAHLLPRFKAESGVDVRVVAVGTGQALDMARRGDADIVFVHDTAAELAFVAQGFATERRDVMYNDFVLIGPAADPAGVKGNDIAAALKNLAATNQPLVSRGDKSGTHAAELRLWATAGVPMPAAKPAVYKECGCGMGPALNMAVSMNGYIFADRGTWLAFKNRGELAVLVQGDRRLFNPYGVMVVNPARFPHVKAELARRFADWLTSPAGQAAIADYKIGGEAPFTPSAR